MPIPRGPRARLAGAGTGALAALALALSACGGGVVGGGAAAKNGAITLAMHFNVPQVSWVGLYEAQEKGYFKDAGVNVKFQYLKGTTLAVQSVGSGQAPMGVAAPDGVLAGAEKNLAITAVANNVQRDGTGVILKGSAPPQGGLNALRGKTIATAQASADSAMLKAALAKAGLTSAVKVINVDPQAKCSLVVSGKADGCTGFSYAQQVQVRQKGTQAQFIPFSTAKNPLPGNMIIANKDYLAKNGETVRKFLDAAAKGYKAAQDDPEGAVDLMARTAPNTPKKELAETVPTLLDLSRSRRSDQHGWGWMDDTVWKDLADELVAGKVLAKAPAPSSVYTNDHLPKGGR